MVVGMTSIALLAQLERGECKNTRNAKKNCISQTARHSSCKSCTGNWGNSKHEVVVSVDLIFFTLWTYSLYALRAVFDNNCIFEEHCQYCCRWNRQNCFQCIEVFTQSISSADKDI